jgi:hypothetical protein
VVGFWLVDINRCATTHYTLGILDTVDEDDKFRTRTLLFQHHVVCSIGLDDLHSFAEVPSPNLHILLVWTLVQMIVGLITQANKSRRIRVNCPYQFELGEYWCISLLDASIQSNDIKSNATNLSCFGHLREQM